jgi:type I restriction enzyme S subunit
MTAFPKYPKYKDSGLEWLGEVPEHWEMSRSRRVFTQRKELARKNDQQLSATQAYGVIPQADYEERIGRNVVKISMHLEKRKHVEPDDFVISMRSFQGGLERAWARGCIRSSYTVLEPAIKVAPSYFAYLFKCPQYIGALQSTGNFIRDGQDLTYQNYILVGLPLPPLAEQERIGAFLDEKTAQIDALIAKKQRQIELLDEQKTILINRAVTRGVNPHAKLKDSGIEWIGQIPAHWEAAKGLRYFHETDFRSVTGNEELLSVSHLTGVTPRSEKNITMFMAESYEGSKLCEVGDIAVNTMWAWMAALAVSRYRGLVSPSYSTYRQKKPKAFDSAYLDHLLRTEEYRSHYTIHSTGITSSRLRLYPHSFLRLKFLCPPLSEQVAIVKEVNSLRDKITKASGLFESQIQTLQTLRSTLIAHAVTGKIAIPAATA